MGRLIRGPFVGGTFWQWYLLWMGPYGHHTNCQSYVFATRLYGVGTLWKRRSDASRSGAGRCIWLPKRPIKDPCDISSMYHSPKKSCTMKNSIQAIVAVLYAFGAINVRGIWIHFSKNCFLKAYEYDGPGRGCREALSRAGQSKAKQSSRLVLKLNQAHIS